MGAPVFTLGLERICCFFFLSIFEFFFHVQGIPLMLALLVLCILGIGIYLKNRFRP